MTSSPSLRADVRNASDRRVDADAPVDKGPVTNRNLDDLPTFCAKVVG